MAINKNHEFEELDGVKCAIVEKNVSKERTEFLKDLLEYNRYTVVVVPSPPPKVAAAPPAPKPTPTTDENTQPQSQPQPVTLSLPKGQPEPPPPPPPPPSLPETFTIGVTDVTFNPTNAIFGRTLKTKDGHIVTHAYWQQKESVSHDEVPYFEKK